MRLSTASQSLLLLLSLTANALSALIRHSVLCDLMCQVLVLLSSILMRLLVMGDCISTLIISTKSRSSIHEGICFFFKKNRFSDYSEDNHYMMSFVIPSIVGVL